MTTSPPLVSIVISAYNEESNVSELFRQLKVLEQAVYRYEYLFVDDGSTDGTAREVAALGLLHPEVQLLSFTRNFGHEVAMLAGLDHAHGDVVIFMDADLQHPPEMTVEMLRLWSTGKRVVLTHRTGNEDRPWLYRQASNLFYRFLDAMSERGHAANQPDFRLIDHKYIDYLRQFREPASMFRGFVSWLRSESEVAVLDFHAPQRQRGLSKYSFFRLLSLAVDAVFSFSLKPLRLALFLAIAGIVASLLVGLDLVHSCLDNEKGPSGFMTTIFAILFLGSLQLFVLSIIGEYVGRIHMQVKYRPLYVVKETVNVLHSTENQRR
jgi:dolichol-phosphate mannosyltransferase